MRSCPSCGAPAKPDARFCGQCGSPLEPESGSSGTEVPVSRQVPPTFGRFRKILVPAVAVILILLVIAGSVLVTNGMKNTSAAPVPKNASAITESYVIIETEIDTIVPPTTLPPTTVTLPQTSIPITIKTPKGGICPSDRRLCNNTCTDILSDKYNCGYCGVTCPTGKTCINGNCMLDCPGSKTACVEGCFDLNTDADHCGICNNNCPAGLICSNGQCSPPPTSYTRAF